jgi:RimJ/RimL family protein N-acetyltransferase
MERKIYISNGYLSLAEYIKESDDIDTYNCWSDPETQRGYNYKFTSTFDEYKNKPHRSRFLATIIRCSDNAKIGSIFLSPENTLPDLAIMLYKQYRGQGYGTTAFTLGTQYCFEVLKLYFLNAGCYESNHASMKMLKKCGFQPHPEGNLTETHYLSGKTITQLDFIKQNEKHGGNENV